MKRIFVVYMLTLAGLIAWGISLRSETRRLESGNAELIEQARPLEALESENARLKSLSVKADQIVEGRGEIMELQRLRAEAARLRALSGESAAELEDEVRAKEKELEAANRTLHDELDLKVRDANSKLRSRLGRRLLEWLEEFRQEKGRYPGALEAFRPRMAGFEEEISRQRSMSSGDLPPDYARQIAVSLKDFELMKAGPDGRLILRAREASHVRGHFQRYYGAPGPRARLRTAWSENGRFEEWERKFIAELEKGRSR